MPSRQWKIVKYYAQMIKELIHIQVRAPSNLCWLIRWNVGIFPQRPLPWNCNKYLCFYIFLLSWYPQTSAQFIDFIQISPFIISSTQTILYQLKRDMAAWNRLWCLNCMQWTWWQIRDNLCSKVSSKNCCITFRFLYFDGVIQDFNIFLPLLRSIIISLFVITLVTLKPEYSRIIMSAITWTNVEIL